MTILKKVRVRLTLLCTGVTTLILFLISGAYLLLAESNLKDNQFKSFQNDIKTITSNLESQSIITYDWLAKLEAGDRYLVFLKDNDVSLLYENRQENEDRESLYQSVKTYYEENQTKDVSSYYSTYHEEFTFAGETTFPIIKKNHYYVSYCYIPKGQGHLEAYILKPLQPMYTQIYSQRALFAILGVLAVFLLFCFFLYLVKLMLKPVEENQKKQNLFVAAASHEFRTPLAVIMSCLSAMRNPSGCSTDTSLDFLEIMEGETERMSHLINDMLLLTNQHNPNHQLQIEDCELETLLLKCYEGFEQMAMDKKISFHIQLPEDPMPLCYCDPEKISQLLAILSHNAISYTEPGGKITFSAKYRNSHHYIWVVDTGIGILDEDKKKIFEQFYRVDNARSKKNHFGLGLSIAMEIVMAHKARLTVTDTPGGGSTFLVRL